MIRLSLLATAAVAVTALATPALAGKAENCAAFASIAGKAVTLRSTGGTDEATAAARLQTEAEGTEAIFVAEIPMIVNWIYTLPAEQLTPEVASVAQAQCMNAG